MHLRLRLIDFWQTYLNEAALSDGLKKQLGHLFYLYGGKSVKGELVWAALCHHPDPEALEHLLLAHNEVEVGERPDLIQHKRPRWKIEGNEVLLFIFYVLMAVGWFMMMGPGLHWIYGDPSSMSLLDKIGSTTAVIIASGILIFYVRYCFKYIGVARAARRLTQTERMSPLEALRLRSKDIWGQFKGLIQKLRSFGKS